MFSQLGFVRLRAAEKALREGRLDEAFRIACAADLKDHRRAGDVRAALSEKFLARAREHFQADRFREAMADLDKAASGQQLQEAIAELRQHVSTVFNAMNQSEESRRQRMDEARKRMETGSLAAGQRILEAKVTEHREFAQLRRHLQHRAEDVSEIVKQTERLLKDGQISPAVERLRRAKSIDAHHESAVKLETDLCSTVFENVRRALVEGKMARASDELACLQSLGSALPTKRELADMLNLARQAGQCLSREDFAGARQHAMSLQRLLPQAKWLSGIVDQLRQVDELRAALRAGPLAERVTSADVRPAPIFRRTSPDDTIAIPTRGHATSSLPERLLLLVDGGGSYLLLRGPTASIGRVAAEIPADIPLFSDLAERHANINRVDDDYFLFSEKDVEINATRSQRQLLRDGDRIVFGRKAKLTFRLPSRQSATAVLELSETSKMPQDVRRIVLMDRLAMIGNSSTAHVRCRHAGSALILFDRDGELWIRPRNDGHQDVEAKRLMLGQPIEVAGVGVTLSPWQIKPIGATNA